LIRFFQSGNICSAFLVKFAVLKGINTKNMEFADNQAQDNLIAPPLINLENLIRSKNPRLLKFLPRFILEYVRNVIHENEINTILQLYHDKQGIDFINAVLSKFKVIIQYEGLDNLSLSKRHIIASNHPLGGLDSLALMSVVSSVRSDIIFPANDLLLNLPNIRKLFIPINKHGSNKQNVKFLEDTFASDCSILFFPAGLCSRKIHHEIIDLEWKKTFVSKARQYQRSIVPVYISGRNSNFFYRLANLRKFLGIKANFEMLYLVDEMFKQKDKVLKIIFGKPIEYKIFDNRFTDKQWAEHVKRYVYAMGRGEKTDFATFLNNN